jgi:putative transposase
MKKDMKTKNSELMPRRKNVRLKCYDYSLPGAYFITICTKNKTPTISSGKIRSIIENVWYNLPNHYQNISLDEFVIMPNHIHGLIIIKGKTDTKLSEIIRAFKSFSTREINKMSGAPGQSFWQRNYYEHIIRNEKELLEIRQYIRNNPLQWQKDEYYAEL